MVVRGSATIGWIDQMRVNWHARSKITLALMLPTIVMLLVVEYWDLRAKPGELARQAVFIGMLFVLIVAAGAALFMAVAALRTWRMSAEQRDMTYEFNDEGYLVQNRAGGALFVPWNKIRWAHESAREIHLQLKLSNILYVPLRAFAPADLPALRGLLREKLGRWARLKGG